MLREGMSKGSRTQGKKNEWMNLNVAMFWSVFENNSVISITAEIRRGQCEK